MYMAAEVVVGMKMVVAVRVEGLAVKVCSNIVHTTLKHAHYLYYVHFPCTLSFHLMLQFQHILLHKVA